MIDDAGDTGGRLGLSGMELQESIVEDREREREMDKRRESSNKRTGGSRGFSVFYAG